MALPGVKPKWEAAHRARSACCEIRVVSLQDGPGVSWQLSSVPDKMRSRGAAGEGLASLCRMMCGLCTAEHISHLHFLTVNRSDLLSQLEWDGVIQCDWMPHCTDCLLLTGGGMRKGSEEFFPQSEKLPPSLRNSSRKAVLAVPIQWPSSSTSSAKAQERRNTCQSLFFTCSVVCRRCRFSFLLSLLTNTLDKMSHLKGLPIRQEENKGIVLCLCSSFPSIL